MKLFVFIFFVSSLAASFEEFESALVEYGGMGKSDDPETHENNTLANLEGIPSSIVSNVSVISGSLVLIERDLEVLSPVPLVYERSWDDESYGQRGHGWNDNWSGSMWIDKVETKPNHIKYQASYVGPFNERYSLRAVNHSKSLLDCEIESEQFRQSITNSSSRISGKTNLHNCRLSYDKKNNEKIMTLIKGDKSKHHFEGDYHRSLKWIDLPNGTSYFIDDGDVIARNRIEQQVGFILRGKENEIGCPNGWCKYIIENKSYKIPHGEMGSSNFLTKVERSSLPEVKYEYHRADHYKSTKLAKRMLPDSRYFEIDYYTKKDKYKSPEGLKAHVDKHNDYRIDRVFRILAPLGRDDKPHVQNEYWYVKGKKRKDIVSYGRTLVYDALKRKTQYDHFDRRLEKITRFKDDNVTILNTEIIKYPLESTNSNAGDITLHALSDSQSQTKIVRKYTYDRYHNPIKEELFGNFSGKASPIKMDLDTYEISGGECFVTLRNFSQDGFNNLLREQTAYGVTDYCYEENSSRLSLKIEQGFEGFCRRTHYTYDLNSQIIKEVNDDGRSTNINDISDVTERFIQETTYDSRGLAIEKVFKFLDENREEKLVKREVNTYGVLGKVTQQKIYDENDVLFTVNVWEYDRYGNAIFEKNGLGYEIHRTFDLNGNLLKETGPYPGQVKLKSYDFMNRIIKDEEINGDESFSCNYFYDLCGNLTSKIDIFGNETKYEYNSQNKLIKTIHSPIQNENGDWIHPVDLKSYDDLGRLYEERDPLGHVKRIYRTIHDKPYKIEYPDQTSEQMEYNFIGQMTRKIEKNGTVTIFDRDSKNRPHKTLIYASQVQNLV